MAAPILNAITHGYPSYVVVNNLMRRYPQYAGRIAAAQALGYHSEDILNYLAGGNPNESNRFLTEHERTLNRDAEQKRSAALKVLGAIGTTGAVAAGVGYYAGRGGAIQPNQILPAQRQALGGPGQGSGPTIIIPPRGPRGGGGEIPQSAQRQGITQQRQQLPYFPGNEPTPQHPQAPAPIQPSSTPAAPAAQPQQASRTQRAFESLDPERKMRNKMTQLAQAGNDPMRIAAYFSAFSPREVVQLEKRAGITIEDMIQEYLPSIMPEMQQMPTQREMQQPMQQPQMAPPVQPEQQAPIQPAPLPPDEMLSPEQEAMLLEGQQPTPSASPSIRERTQQAAFSGQRPPRISEVPALEKSNFSIPNYYYKGESKEDFDNRKMLFDAVKKAADALLKGQSFLDFPLDKDTQFSTAIDVLRFIGGIPNIYSALLDDEEKEELSNALIETTGMHQGLAPTKGERDIHGAQITPNLVWNLLLAVEPRIKKMERPPSVKGYKMAPGGKMGTAELRRFLTHGVYGVLSGKSIAPDLANKIQRISNASSGLDEIAKAAKAGNMRKMESEMERLMDDAEFMAIMSQEIPELLDFKLTEEQSKEDTKTAAALKAKATRKSKKKKSEVLNEELGKAYDKLRAFDDKITEDDRAGKKINPKIRAQEIKKLDFLKNRVDELRDELVKAVLLEKEEIEFTKLKKELKTKEKNAD